MRRVLAITGGLCVVLLLVVAQLVLPGIAASSLRNRLSKSGRVISVKVSAFPAIELLWHAADQVTVRMATYHSNPGHLTSLLDQAGTVGNLTASVGTLNTGLLTLHNATLTKRGNRLTGTAELSETDLRASIPILQSVSFVSSGGGILTLDGTGTFAGLTAKVPFIVRPENGHLVGLPDVPLIGSALTVTVFSDPHVRVLGVSGAARAGGLSLSAAGQFQ